MYNDTQKILVFRFISNNKINYLKGNKENCVKIGNEIKNKKTKTNKTSKILLIIV